MKTYHNLQELISDYGDTPYSVGRSLYKYTDCGPWTSFIFRDKPSSEHFDMGEIRVNKATGLLHCTKGCERVRQFLGFGPNGTAESKWKSLDAYYDRIKDFVKKNPDSEFSGWRITSFRRCIGCVRVEFHKTEAATTRDVYYEDWRKDGDFPQIQDCIGIKVGSIVEGSDVEIEPEILMFPFTDEQLYSTIRGINDQAGYYWERDNSQWYQVSLANRDYYLRNTWGDISWDGDKPSPALRKKVEAFIHDQSNSIPEMPGVWSNSRKDWKPAGIPGTRATIHRFINDSIY